MECSKRRLELLQAYLKILFWDHCFSWFISMACLRYSYLVVPLFSSAVTFAL